MLGSILHCPRICERLIAFVLFQQAHKVVSPVFVSLLLILVL
jgi:hypothetical protein